MGCGSSSSSVEINLDRQNAFFYGGEVVSGVVNYNVNDETVNVDELVLKCFGEVGYTSQKTVVINGQTTTQTIHNDIPIISSNHVLVRPENGQEDLTFGKGQHSFPFQIQLPTNLPPTMNQPQTYPHVRYYVQMYVDRAWYKANTRENRYITVFPRVNLAQVPNSSKPTVFSSQNQKDFSLKGNLNKLGYIAGETIQGTIDIDNPKQAIIKQIVVTLIRNFRMGGASGEHVIVRSTIPEMMRRQDPRINQPFTLMIPATSLPPSYQFDGGLNQVTSAHTNYILKFQVQFEGVITDFELLVPIIIGTEPNPS
ncbi:hypothetical protein I4U23_004106 [Adineta vaga]|nr:hypothetical protein I4U23_004106 [Adineta vaga]